MVDQVAEFERQADACRELGSPMYAALLRRMAADLGTGGPLDRVLAGHEDDPPSSALSLRLLGTVHRLVLEGRAGDLARHYPSVGGRFALDDAWPALHAVLDQQTETVAEGLDTPPQTNEVGRAAALVGGLLRLPAAALPVRLFELGASAGLNLRADRFGYSGATGWWGPPDSPVVLEDAWQGVPTPVDRRLVVVERTGCDPAPIDPATEQGRTLLAAYVWPDQQARLHRLRGALEVAARVPATVRRQRAADLMAALQVRPGHCTVLWHSVMWQYVDPAEQAVVREHIERLGGQADADAPFVHLWLEPERRSPDADHEFLVRAQQWPGAPAGSGDAGSATVLGTSGAHGPQVTWER